jgi:hypothetical protein
MTKPVVNPAAQLQHLPVANDLAPTSDAPILGDETQIESIRPDEMIVGSRAPSVGHDAGCPVPFMGGDCTCSRIAEPAKAPDLEMATDEVTWSDDLIEGLTEFAEQP